MIYLIIVFLPHLSPVKGTSMVEKKDVPMNTFPQVADVTYIYGEETDGSQCKIGKGSIAESLRPYLGVVYTNDIIDCNTLKEYRVYAAYRWHNAPISNIAILEVLPYGGDWVVQRFHDISINEIWVRTFVNGSTWTSWRKISFT